MALALASCGEPQLVLSSPTTTGAETVGPTTSIGVTGKFDIDTDGNPACDADGDCPEQIDLLFVIDNSRTMGEEQLNLAKNFPMLIEQLEALEGPDGRPAPVDVNIMVTTTDFGNTLCTPFEKDDYDPAKGAPIYSACTDRINRFNADEVVVEEACYGVCDPDDPVAPTEQFIHFDPWGDNVPRGTPAQALSCIGPQGIDGCGYESPLESMLQGLNPFSCWNDPGGCADPAWDWIERPFLRPSAILAVAIITDEADCSVEDFGIMEAPDFMEPHPDSGISLASSSICWNAGVECNGFDPMTEEFSDCWATNMGIDGTMNVDDDAAVLQPLSRYKTYLQALKDSGKEVIMLGILGVPEVTNHAADPPYNPVAGGVDDLVYREWKDPDYPNGGDILPEEWDAGVRAEDKRWEFKVGPGCTGYDAANDVFTGQAIPPVRVREVCESLNEPGRIRCCIESICDDDFSPAIRCLTGIIQDVFEDVP